MAIKRYEQVDEQWEWVKELIHATAADIYSSGVVSQKVNTRKGHKCFP